MASNAKADKVKYFQLLVEDLKPGLNLLKAMSKENENMVMRYYGDAFIKIVEKDIEKVSSGTPIVAHNFGFPTEILYYYDIVPITVEAFSYLMSGRSEEYYDIMNNWGHPHHTCTAQKGVMGMMKEKLLEFDLVVSVSSPCDNAIGSYPAFKYLQENSPNVKVIDMPYYRDERSYNFFTEELVKVKDDIGKLLGQEPSEERFRKAIEIENKNLALVREIHELKKAIPCPVESILVPIFAYANIGLRANPERTRFLENILEYMKDNYKKGIKPNAEEKIRTIWPNMTIYFDSNYCEELDRRRGMSVLFDVFTYLYYDQIDLKRDEDDLIKQLAHQCLQYPMTRQVQGKADQLIEDTLYLCKEYKADAVIFTNHIACKSLQPMEQLLREVIREELEIPFLSIDVDVGDKRVTPLRLIKRKVNNFVKTFFS